MQNRNLALPAVQAANVSHLSAKVAPAVSNETLYRTRWTCLALLISFVATSVCGTDVKMLITLMHNFEIVNFDSGEKYESVSLSGVFKADDQKLHWLPIASRLQYNIATLCYNSFTKCYPIYLSELLTVYYPCHENLPHIFHKNQDLWTTSFSSTCLTQWKSLPFEVRHSALASSFKQALKNHLFKSAYNFCLNHPHLCVYVCVCLRACVRARVRARAICRCTFSCLQCIRLYMSCVRTDQSLVTCVFIY